MKCFVSNKMHYKSTNKIPVLQHEMEQHVVPRVLFVFIAPKITLPFFGKEKIKLRFKLFKRKFNIKKI